MNMLMARNIAISDAVYDTLVKHKLQGESFSREITRFFGRKGSIAELAGTWALSEKEAASLKNKLAKMRKSATAHVFQKIKNSPQE